MFVATKIYKKCANLWENVQFDNMMTKAVHPHENVAIYTFLRGEKLSQKLCLLVWLDLGFASFSDVLSNIAKNFNILLRIWRISIIQQLNRLRLAW